MFLDEEKVKENSNRVAMLQKIADEAGMTLAHLSLRWLLRRSEVSSVLIGARTVQQLEECAAVSGQPPLPKDVLNAIVASCIL